MKFRCILSLISLLSWSFQGHAEQVSAKEQAQLFWANDTHTVEKIRQVIWASDLPLAEKVEKLKSLNQEMVTDLITSKTNMMIDLMKDNQKLKCLSKNRAQSAKVVFWGERHHSEFAKRTFANLKQFIKNKSHVVALESFSAPLEQVKPLTPLAIEEVDKDILIPEVLNSPLVFALDSPETRALASYTALLSTNVMLPSDANDPQALLGRRFRIFDLIGTSGLSREIFLKARSRLDSNDLLVKVLSEAASEAKPTDTERTEAMVNALKKHQVIGQDPETGVLLPQFEASWDRVFSALVSQAYLEFVGKPLDADQTKILETLIENPRGAAIARDFFLVDYRDMVFAVNIVAAWCQASDQNLDLHVSLGASHLSGTSRHLKTLTQGLNIPMEFEFDPVYLESMRKEIAR